MDIFRFGGGSMNLGPGARPIASYDSCTWIERYSEAGEFEIRAPRSSGLQEFLPIDSCISHTGSSDIMFVESHEVADDMRSTSDIIIKGRSLEAWFDNRSVGSQRDPAFGLIKEVNLPEARTWTQAKTLFDLHIDAAVHDINDLIPVDVVVTASGDGTSHARNVRKGGVYSQVLDILSVDDIGIKTVRKGRPGNPIDSGNNRPNIVIFKGVDRSSSIVFSYEGLHIDSADYFWSNRNDKNCFLLIGRHLEYRYGDDTKISFGRKWQTVDVSHIDQGFESPPTGLEMLAGGLMMYARASELSAKKRRSSIAKVDIATDTNRYKYRTDYDIGDIVSVSGNYGETTKMQVIEHVEIFDHKDGFRSYPSLTTLREEED